MLVAELQRWGRRQRLRVAVVEEEGGEVMQ
jgi:hypothetical protein